MQRDLFTHSSFSITPEAGRSEPRLWVRRLVIWREPGNVVRDIRLRPGLNIVWSPDAGTSETAPIGHGSGKTIFCRLLRYCLGEESFAPDDQRLLILKTFPKGHVGAEIVLDGCLWVVVRALGDHRHDMVIENGSFDDAWHEGILPTSIEPLRTAITLAIIGDAAKLMPPTIGELGAWETALAWATRDQECRFGHHLDWRDPNTDSRSPVRGRSVDDRLTIVRAFIGALSADEVATRRLEEREANALEDIRAELGRLDWQIKRTRAALVNVLGGGAEPRAGSGLDASAFKAAAADRLAGILKLPDSARTTDLNRARGERKTAADEVQRLTAGLNEVSIRVEEKNKTLMLRRSELPEAYARLTKEKNPICPICRVPIDKVLAKGCNISKETCDLEALQAHIAKNREAIKDEEAEVAALEARRPQLKADIASARQRLDALERTIAALERSFDDRRATVRAAQRLLRDAEEYEALLSERSTASTANEQIDTRLVRLRETLAAHRASVADTIRHLSICFDAVLREFVPGEIQGSAKLDAKGLTLKVELGGDLSTAAIESLKVVAFDLAALAMTIEGRTRLSGFLVHDSPREADLGRSIYNRLFGLASRLEAFGPRPLFQYIVTTTTEPPEEFRSAPWLCLLIKGAPAEERLLGVDL